MGAQALLREVSQRLESGVSAILRPTRENLAQIGERGAGGIWADIVWLELFLALSLLLEVLVEDLGLMPITLLTILAVFPILLVIWTGSADLVSDRILGGRKITFHSILHLISVSASIILVLSSMLLVIPDFGWVLGWTVFAYGIVLVLLAIRSVAELSIWRSALAFVLASSASSIVCGVIASVIILVPELL